MTTISIPRIDQSKLRENAYDALRDAFTLGQFAPGDTISLRNLADQMGVSMTPIREAVRRLVAEGALIDTPTRTLMVPPFDASRMTELKKARLVLEALILDLAINRMTARTIDAMQAILSTDGDPDQTTPNLRQNYDFHFTLYRQSGSEVLLPLVEALWVQYGAYLNLIIHHPSATRENENEHHHAIVVALRQGDRDGAQQALALDIERSFRILTLGHRDPIGPEVDAACSPPALSGWCQRPDSSTIQTAGVDPHPG
ncbi:GntR family transcriptional regulator [Paracoccus sp. M683]|uniref:GntR family transcriptional regulator n=1 Tax=Paracoccus sp. M683 TaxID=2594268 RepID=UPI00117E8D22|nr:GntR family transcriptional regulator [Paracoccus sp. M683]TRW99412.1 GntR family transcriptional regulator [Paracoccus sp. M683]